MNLAAETLRPDLAGLALLLLAGLAIAVTAMIAYTAWALSRPTRRTMAAALARNRPTDPAGLAGPGGGRRTFREWTFASRGRELPVWDVPGDDPGGPLVVMTHGWGDSRIGALMRMAPLLAHASRVVTWDMPGHGEAPGSCSLGTREPEDLLTLVDRVGRDRPIVLFGWSLGAGVSIAAAARSPQGIAGIVAEAPYRVPATPARNVLRAFALPHRVNLPPALRLIALTSGVSGRYPGFDRASLAASLRCPLLVVHGEDDDICPVEDGRAIAAAAREGRIVVVARTGHHGLWTDERSRTVCERALGEFVQTLRTYDPRRCARAPQSTR